MTTDAIPLPFLRWAGGKRWLAKRLSPGIREHLGTTAGYYREPFLGSGAMFFAVRPERAHLSDVNSELINAFLCVSSRYQEILEFIRSWSVDDQTYYRVRALRPKNNVECAARFIYLNRTCYGGLYRTNRQGTFNVPFGGGSRTPELLWRDEVLRIAAEAIASSSVQLGVLDFESSFQRARKGDLIYCDPAYVAMKRGTFDRYGPEIFAWNDQERLVRLAADARERGCTVLVSNAASRDLIELYSSANLMKMLKRKKRIGNRPNDDDSDYEMLALFGELKATSNLDEMLGGVVRPSVAAHYVSDDCCLGLA